MTKVVALMSMSLDGYVADATDGVAEVFSAHRVRRGRAFGRGRTRTPR